MPIGDWRILRDLYSRMRGLAGAEAPTRMMTQCRKICEKRTSANQTAMVMLATIKP